MLLLAQQGSSWQQQAQAQVLRPQVLHLVQELLQKHTRDLQAYSVLRLLAAETQTCKGTQHTWADEAKLKEGLSTCDQGALLVVHVPTRRCKVVVVSFLSFIVSCLCL